MSEPNSLIAISAENDGAQDSPNESVSLSRKSDIRMGLFGDLEEGALDKKFGLFSSLLRRNRLHDLAQ